MDRVLVNIFIPILNRSFDIYIPLQIQIAEVTALVQKAVVELSEKQFYPDRGTALCWRESGEILDINKLVMEHGICTGSKLMLI